MSRLHQITDAALAIYSTGKNPSFEAIAHTLDCSLRTVLNHTNASQLREEMRAEAVMNPSKCYRLAVEIEAERVGYKKLWKAAQCL